jgi:hypothetical protein
VLFSYEQLVVLLNTSRKNNAPLGITGLLLNKEGNFMQILEGPERAVRELAAKISKDPRHRGIITLLESYSEQRQFADWKMGFKNLKAIEAKSIEGYSEFLNTPLNSRDFVKDPSLAQRLLLGFKNNLR